MGNRKANIWRETWFYKCRKCPSIPAQESNSIVALSLHSYALLLPPFVNWTLSLIYSHSSLTCITFSHLTFPEEVWTTLLPFIADMVSNRVTKLSFFSQCTKLRVTAENLTRFTAHLPHLTHLSVDRLFCSRFQSSRTELKPPYLLRLQVLQAPTELVSLILDVQSRPISPETKRPLPVFSGSNRRGLKTRIRIWSHDVDARGCPSAYSLISTIPLAAWLWEFHHPAAMPLVTSNLDNQVRVIFQMLWTWTMNDMEL